MTQVAAGELSWSLHLSAGGAANVPARKVLYAEQSGVPRHVAVKLVTNCSSSWPWVYDSCVWLAGDLAISTTKDHPQYNTADQAGHLVSNPHLGF
jgi:hypothetical protein